MKKSVKAKTSRTSEPELFIGYLWGEPQDGKSHFIVNRVDEELEITAAMPQYLSSNPQCDLLQQHKIAPKNRSIGKQKTGKDSPHIRFANAECDDDLIEFVRSFGPVVSKTWEMLPFPPLHGPWIPGDPVPQNLMRVRQDLEELRREQRIYKAALGLVNELARKENEFDFDYAKNMICEIARGVRDWPRQWNREKRAQDRNPLWRVRTDSIRKITALANSGRDLLLPPQLDARIVICELVNVFPSLAFPNPTEMHSYIRFGIRPLLYSILKREFLQPRDVGVCANTHCRAFFEVERASQRFCDEVCSRQHRQREYWKGHGKTARRKRLGAQSKRRNVKLPRPTSPGRAI